MPRSPLHGLFRRLLRLSLLGRSLYLPTVALVIECFAAIPGLLLTGGLFFGTLPQDAAFRMRALVPVLVWAAATVFLVYAYASRHIRLFLDMVARGERPPAARAEAAWIEALTLPSRIVQQWLLVGQLSFVAGGWLVAGSRGVGVFILYVLASFIGAGTIILLAFFLLEWAMLPIIEECYRAGAVGDLAAARIARTTQRRKLMVSITTILLIVLALGVTLDFRRASHIEAMAQLPLLLSILNIGALSLPLGLLFSWMLVWTITDSVASLTEAMERVAGGDLTVRAPIISTDEMGVLASHFNEMVAGLRERETLRDAFGRYVSPEVAQVVLNGGAQLGGTTLTATILFADIRNFTALSERLRPDEIIALLNGYYSTMVDAVHAQGGLVNKFIGDGMLVVFGAPLPTDDHALAAVLAATAMRAALQRFNEGQRQIGRPQLQIGIGIATGEVVAGNVGSAARLEYTVLGDPVNLASRIQEMCKTLAHDILICPVTHAALPPRIRATPYTDTPIRGKRQALTIYGLSA